MKKTIGILSLIFGVMIYAGCKKMEMETESYSAVPVLPSPSYNYDGMADDNKATLGRVLFYDKQMSLNNSVSCGTCHQQTKAFCDGKQFTPGLQDQFTRRNTPTVVTHGNAKFWDGRANDFFVLAKMPLENHVEMKNYDISKLEDKIQSISYYAPLFTNAFGTSEVTIDKIQTALGQFMNCFRFDKNKNNMIWSGQATFTAQEQLGHDLFWGKARCSNCHSGQAMAGWVGSNECIGLDESYSDNGIGEITKVETDNAKFRVPPLYNIEYTAPYMHDGRFKTLEEVVEHYNSGVKAHPNLSWALTDFPQFAGMSQTDLLLLFDLNHNGTVDDDEIPPGTPVQLNLTTQEKQSLVAFLKTLSDPTVLTDIRFSDPFRIR